MGGVEYGAFDVDAADIEKSAALYGRLYITAASNRYAAVREEAEAASRKLLFDTDSLRHMEPGLLEEHPDYLEALCCACLPPLTRDKLSVLSGVPARRIANVESGTAPKRGKGELQRRTQDLPAMLNALRGALDPDLTPWLAEPREPKGYEQERFCLAVGDRAAQRRVGQRRESGEIIEKFALETMRAWVDSYGYSAAAGAQEPADLAPGEYALPDAPTEGELLVRPKADGKVIAFDLRIFADAVYAAKLRDKFIEGSRKSHEQGIEKFYVLCGCVSTALLLDLRKSGVRCIWLHDLDRFEHILQDELDGAMGATTANLQS